MDIKTIFNCLMEFCKKKSFSKDETRDKRSVTGRCIQVPEVFQQLLPHGYLLEKEGDSPHEECLSRGYLGNFLLWIGENSYTSVKIHLSCPCLRKSVITFMVQPEFSVLNLTSQILRSLPVSLPLSASIWFFGCSQLFSSLDTLPIIMPGTEQKLRRCQGEKELNGQKRFLIQERKLTLVVYKFSSDWNM